MNGGKIRRRSSNDGKCRFTTWLSKDLLQQLRRESDRRHVSQMRIIETLLLERYSPERREEQEALFIRRLNSIDRHLGEMEKRVEAVGEAIAIYVKMWLTATPDLPEKERAAAISKAQKRFERFVDGVEQNVQAGKTLLSELSKEKVVGDFEEKRSC